MNIVQWMQEHGLALTWENYLAVQFLGNPPAELDGEVLAEMIADFDAAFLEEAGIVGDAEEDE